MKKWISFLLAAAIALTLVLPAGASAAPTFADVSDAATAREVAVLQMMGVLAGTSAGRFSPNGTLTRAQFCKMAVITMGRGSEEPLYRSRTIFPDVRSGHWARGYINLAVTINLGAASDGTGGTKLIRGMGNGTFQPDRAITYAEAVTILIRMLGYSDADAGMLWPKGYLDLAAKIGLTGGLSLTANQSLTRAQAAHLFNKLLVTNQKGADAYYGTLGTAEQDVVVTNGSATADDGTTGAMGTTSGIYKAASGLVPGLLVGYRGVLVTKSGKAVVFIPSGSQKTVTVSEAQAGWLRDAESVKYTIPTTAPAYSSSENSTYDKVWMNLTPGMTVTLYYANTGKINGLYVGSQSAGTAAIATAAGGSSFETLLGGASDYTVYRDGTKASLSDVCLYDVGTYDAASRVLSVSSVKLTGTYENVWPNQSSPAKVTVMGLELPVMSDAMDSMSAFKLGEQVTLLLTADRRVAGAVSASDVRADNVGTVEEADGTNVKVRLLSGLTVTGKNKASSDMKGELVTVGSSGIGSLYLSKVGSSNVSGSLSVSARTVGTAAVSGNAKLYEHVGRSALRQIAWSDLAVDTVSAAKIDYALVNPGGKIDALVLNDVTGDGYTYGFLKQGEKQTGGDGSLTYSNNTIVVLNAENPNGGQSIVGNYTIKDRQPGGILPTAAGDRIAGFVTLTEKTGVKRSAFHVGTDVTTVTLGTLTMRVSDKVECYNAVTGKWFASLADARAFSDNLTVYYDKTPAEGGKIRLVVAN